MNPNQTCRVNSYGVEISPQDILDLGRYYAKKKAAYFEALLYLMSTVATDQVETMGVSRSLVAFWNPAFLATLTEAEAAGLWAHEAMHPLLGHAERCEQQGYDPKVGNVAGDLAINSALQQGGWTLPKCGQFPKDYGFPENLTMDEYYALLVKKFGGREQAREGLEQAAKDQPQDGGSSGGQKGGKEPPKGAGQGQGKGAQGAGAPGGAGERKRGRAGEGDCGGCSGNPLSGDLEPGAKDPRSKSLDQLENARQSAAEKIAEQIAQKGIGSVPNLLARWAELRRVKPKIPWQRYLQRAIRQAVEYRKGNHDYYYGKPSRRQAAYEEMSEILGAPATPIRPSMHTPIPKVDVGVDTSGSMGSEELSRCAAEIDGILRTLGGAEIGVWGCDCRMQAFQRARSVREAARAFVGGGGTSFDPFFEHMLAQRQRPQVIVILTDGMGPVRATPPPGVQVFWVLIGPHASSPCSWGTHLMVHENEN